MGTCCTSDDSVPKVKTGRNTTENMEDPLIGNTNEAKSDIGIEGDSIDINIENITSFILSLSETELIKAWKHIDTENANEIIIGNQLQKLFYHFIESFITQKVGSFDTLYTQKSNHLSKELSNHFEAILTNYKHLQQTTLKKSFFLKHFQQYLKEPNADNLNDEVSMNEDESEQMDENEDESQSGKVRDFPNTPSNVLYNTQFDMLSFISTSPTIFEKNDFSIDHTLSLLRSALKSDKNEKAEKLAEILCSLSESQRVAVSEAYTSKGHDSLQDALNEHFGGDLLLIFGHLIHSNAYNDAECIEKQRHKININTNIINEILMSRTNAQIIEIEKAYKERFDRQLMHSLNTSFNALSYGLLLKSILSNDSLSNRNEFDPKYINYSKIKSDAKRIYQILEQNTGKLKKKAVIELFCKKSWNELAILCKEYGKKSKYDLKTVLIKKFGSNSKTGDCLVKIIDVSRNRASFFAQLLYQSMKGMSVDNEALIRIIVGRSGIDLGEISAAFSQKYGKTLYQFIKTNVKKGSYANILLRICQINDQSHDDFDEDDCKVFESANDERSKSVILSDEFEEKEQEQSIESQMCTAPTIVCDDAFNANNICDALLNYVKNKKTKKNAKKLLIRTMTRIDNKQRQLLKNEFEKKGVSMDDFVKEIFKKGKILTLFSHLLQTPAQFEVSQIKMAIKSNNIKHFVEVILGCTNLQIDNFQKLYNGNESNSLMEDVNAQMFANNKDQNAQFMICKMLECTRSESLLPDKKLCQIHLNEIEKMLNKDNKNQNNEMQTYFCNFFTNESFVQIRFTMNRFNMTSDQTLSALIKKIFGKSSQSGVIIENIMKIASNRSGFYAEKLRDSMKGMSTSEAVIIRILISRAEKDLGDIVECFAEENFGDGKTLKQWMQNALKGSLRSALLCIAGLSEDDGSDMSVTEYESDAQLTSNASPNVYSPISPSLHSDVGSADIYSSEIETSADDGMQASVGDFDPYEINEHDFGVFILDKVNDKTAKRLMQHLKSGNGKNKNANDDIIKASQVIHVLLFICVLFIKYQEKTHRRPEIQIDKKVLKKSLIPPFNWMMENRLRTMSQQSIKKSEYKILGKWLKEYYKQKEKK